MQGRSSAGAALVALSLFHPACNPDAGAPDAAIVAADVPTSVDAPDAWEPDPPWDTGTPTDASIPLDVGLAPIDTPLGSDVANVDVVVACSVQAPTSCPSPSPHYADVSPIFQSRCVGPCHNGALASGPWPLTGYDHVSDWQDTIRDQLLHCTMPPTDAGVPMSDDERAAILVWIRCGLPR